MSDNWQITADEFRTTVVPDGMTVEELEELAEGFKGYEGLDFHWYVSKVAERIFEIHQARNVANQFVFDLTCDNDGGISGGVVALSIPQTSLYLTTPVEWKRMTNDRATMDMQGLLAIKDALLDYEYGNIWRMAEVWGLTHSFDEEPVDPADAEDARIIRKFNDDEEN